MCEPYIDRISLLARRLMSSSHCSAVSEAKQKIHEYRYMYSYVLPCCKRALDDTNKPLILAAAAATVKGSVVTSAAAAAAAMCQ